MPVLTEDDVDDLLYFARTGELQNLQNSFSAISKSSTFPQLELLFVAADPVSGNGLLHMASANGHTETLKYLFSLIPAPSQSTPSMLSLIINAQNYSGNTPLHWASLNGHLEAVKVLVAAGADPAIANKAGHDVVYEAEVNGKADVVEWLLKEGNGLEKGLGVSGGEGENGEEDAGEGEADGEAEMDGVENGSEMQELEEGVGKIQMT